MRPRLLIAQLIRKNPVVRRLYYRARLSRATSEADECAILARLAQNATPTFIEFGFEPVQFNCVALAKHPAWQGLLIDGGKDIVEDARRLWPDRIRVENAFLSLDNLDLVRNQFEKVGVLSIDVDGNDYWILKALIDLAPDIISVEYNATFGLRPVTTIYDPAFNRMQKDPRGWYHGASLTALTKLCAEKGLQACRRLGWKLQRVLHQRRQSQAGRRVQAQTTARRAVGNPTCGAVGPCQGHAV